MDKKSVVMLIVLAVVVFSIISVSAGLWDIFKFGKSGGGEGELPESAPAYVTVGAPPFAPNITFVSKPWPSGVGGSAFIDLASGTFTDVNFSFYATKIMGPTTGEVGDLIPGGPYGSPNSPGGSSIGGNNINVSGNFTYGGTTRYITNCWYMGDISYISMNHRNYTCTVRMYYYDDPTVWNINIAINDTSGRRSVTNSTQTFSVNALRYFYIIPPSSVNWTNPGITLGATNQYSNFDLKINNTGNINITTGGLGAGLSRIVINATFLNGTNPGEEDETIAAGNFTANGYRRGASPNGCTLVGPTTKFVQDLNTNLSINISKGPLVTGVAPAWVGEGNLTFCIPYISNIVIQPYNSSRNWELLQVNN